ncbi:UDP-N-acetylglucosamine--N-acetylmuramyl-(pentapeptide) pyrophosphoryl-undecaprenol N-acetylglucosamine transferase [Candidatus Peregrinibacteria bacterium]|nr:UDP-N-acetylglucosamine--N-acetylmuramyl-(pentapeptide) pyrophosphoryl-undecaprenol N-acetylglucosamine transferase [Candidatus Peregrinibacteria bacterium]
MPRLLACGSGSIGHLAPLVAICRALLTLAPSTEILISCGMRPEEGEYLRREHMPFATLPQPRRSWSFPQTFLRSYRAACHLLASFQPDLILSRGGAISVPLCLAATRKHLPVVLHESDSVMGLATRCTAWWARTITTGFPLENYPLVFRSRITATGNPVRPEIMRGSREEGLRITRFSGKKPILLALGGSQGAQAINEAVVHLLPELTKLCDIIHITGPGKRISTPYPLPPISSYWSAEYVHSELPHLYASATLALSRAGAGVLSELAANGVPSIIVPLRGLAQDHQWHNARFFAQYNACILLEQEEIDRRLVAEIQSMIHHPNICTELGESFLSLHRPDAARHIAEIVLKNIA